MNRIHTCTLFVLVLVVFAAALSACGPAETSTELETVNDASGLFHVKVPNDWSSLAEEGLVVLYASDTLPEEERIDDLSVAIFSTDETTDTPVPETLTFVVDRRAADRSWKDYSRSEPRATSIGGREGSFVEVTGTDANGQDFRARYHYIRTSGRDVLVIAVAPSAMWDVVVPEVDTLIADEWYWHTPAGGTP